MPHQCVRCGKIYIKASQEILTGCSDCGGKFFFYIKEEQLARLKEEPIMLQAVEKEQIERDVREMVGAVDEETPVILDLESVRVTSPGKFELDLVKLFNKKMPLIYKLEEGKYIIDLASTLQKNAKDLKEISKRELWLMGVMLYWRERFLHNNESDLRKGVRFTSSDPNLINFFLRWLQDIGGLQKEELGLDIFIGQNKKNVKGLLR